MTAERAPFMVLLTDAYGGHGGIAKFNRDFLGCLSTFDGGSGVVALPRVAQFEVQGVPDGMVFDTRGLGGKGAYVRTVMRRLVRTPSASMIVCAHINLLPVAVVAKARYRAPLVLVVHGIDAWRPPRNPLAISMLEHVSSVLSVSAVTKERFLGWSRLPEERVQVVPNSVDLSTFGPGPKPSGLVERYRLTGKRVILTLGRLASHDRYKGFDEVLEVLPRILRDVPEAVYLVAGDGPDRARLEAKAKMLEVAHAVRFTGRVEEHEKADTYRCADVFALPSRGEGFGIVLLDAAREPDRMRHLKHLR
ncbi:glycosyltransferase, partial [bacterium]